MGLFSANGNFGLQSRKRINAYNVWMMLFVSIGSMCYGYTANVISATLAQPSFLAYFQLSTRSNGTALISATNGIFQAGGVLGTLTLSVWCDRFGRKGGLGVSASLIIISGAVLAGSTNIAEFLVFRFFAGAGAFMILAAVPIWMSEVVPPYFRGALVQLHAVSLVVGYMAASWLGYGLFFWKDSGLVDHIWRVPFAVQCLWPTILLAGLYWVPESPRWLILKDRHEDAKRILLRLHDDPNDVTHTFARIEYLQITKQLAIDRGLPSSWNAIIQCSGILVINNYGPELYKSLGFNNATQLLYGAAWLTLAFGLNGLAIFLNDHYPRNKFLAVGVFGCMVVLSVEAALVASFVPSTNYNALRAAVAFLFLIELPYDLFLDGMQFTYISEIWPMHLRAKGMSLAVAMTSLMNIIWLQSAPTAFANIGWRFYLAFIIPGTIGAAVIWFFFPDTLGLPLEEVAALFGDQDEVAGYMRDIQVTDDDIDKFDGFGNSSSYDRDALHRVVKSRSEAENIENKA